MGRSTALGLVLTLLAAACRSSQGAAPPATLEPDAGEPVAVDAGIDTTFVPHSTCEKLAVARCRLAHRCFAAFDRLALDDCRAAETAQCESDLAAIAAAVRAGRASLDEERLDSCLSRMDADPCTALLPPDAPAAFTPRAFEDCQPAALFAGRVADGEVCRLDQDCARASRCLQFDGTCGGVCTPYTGLGELCGGACDPATAFCSDLTGRCVPLAHETESCKYPARCALDLLCVDDVCQPLPKQDESCQVLTDRPASCGDGLVCDFPPLLSGKGTCRAQGAEGAACLYHWSCLAGLVCAGLDWSAGAASAPGPGTCSPPRAEGEACSYTPLEHWLGDECGAGLTCRGASKTCARRPAEGEACQLEVQDCTGVGLVCSPDASQGGRCGYTPGLGEVCRAEIDGPLGYVELPCRDGFCDPDLNVCRAAYLAEGEPCTLDAQCLTYRCVVLPNLVQICGKRCPR